MEEEPKENQELQTQEPVNKDEPYKDPITGKWKNYHPKKGVKPPWDPFNPEKRKNALTFNERKFLYVLGRTGKLNDAYLTAYKVREFGDPKLQATRITSMANQVLARIKRKQPELANQMTFGDINGEFVKKGLLKLLEHPEASIHEKTRIFELMGKMNDVNIFSDKHVIETKITEVKRMLYSEEDDDFPTIDKRLTRDEIEAKILTDNEGRMTTA